MLAGFQDALAQKYAIMGQQANTAQAAQRSAAELNTAQAGQIGAQTKEIGANAASNRALQGAESGLYGAEAGESTQRGGLYGAEAAGQRLDNTQSAVTGGQANKAFGLGDMNSMGDPVESGTYNGGGTGFHLSKGTASVPGGDRLATPQELMALHQHLCMGGTVGHYAEGTDRVQPINPGPPAPALVGSPERPSNPAWIGSGSDYDNFAPRGDGSGPYTHQTMPKPRGYAGGAPMVPGPMNPQTVGTPASDTVPAQLAPGEAVLNTHAADIIGRDKVAAANQIGNHIAETQRIAATMDGGAAPGAPAPAAAGPQAKPPAGKSAPGKGMVPPKAKAAPGAPAKAAPTAAAKPPVKSKGMPAPKK